MSNNPLILVVDDENEIRSMLNVFFSVEDLDVIEADSGKSGLHQVVSSKPDLILLDLGLPDIDGQEVIKSVRQFSNVPIVVLSARAEDAQVVQALNSGADDYVNKPFHADILLARIKTNLRRVQTPAPTENILENGPIRMDLVRHEVHLKGRRANFTPKEFSLLRLFVTNRGRLLTHKQILRDVWGPSHTDDTQYLRVYIGQVREKLEAEPGLGKAITSESGIGYRMENLTYPTPVPAE